jgi:hypothetical protein
MRMRGTSLHPPMPSRVTGGLRGASSPAQAALGFGAQTGASHGPLEAAEHDSYLASTRPHRWPIFFDQLTISTSTLVRIATDRTSHHDQ